MAPKALVAALWLASVLSTGECSPQVPRPKATPVPVATKPFPTAAASNVTTATGPKSTAKSTAKGINPAIASALAEMMAGRGGNSPEADAIGVLLGGAQAPRPNFAPMAPLAQAAGLRGGLPTIHPPGRNVPPGATPVAIRSVTGKGDASIYNCWQSHISYNHETYSYFNASGKAVSTTLTIPSSTMHTAYHNTSVPTSVGCDGHPRILGETTTQVTLTFTDASMVTQKQVFPAPTPTCTIPDNQCNVAMTAYDSSSFSYVSSAYFNYFLDADRPKSLPNLFFGHFSPPCQTTEACPAASKSAVCSLGAERATVFYWPTSTLGNLCSRGPVITHQSNAAAAHTTAVWGTHTVTSPSALVILRSLAASQHPKVTVTPTPEYIGMNRCGSRVNATLNVNPDAISSFRSIFSATYVDPGRYTGYKMSSVAHPFNFAELNPGQVPWDAYVAPGGCNPSEPKTGNNCPETILPNYTPVLAVPSLARGVGIEDEFALCNPNRVNAATFLAITATKLEMPSETFYGAKVSVSPRFSSVKPGAAARVVLSEPTFTPEVVPFVDT